MKFYSSFVFLVAALSSLHTTSAAGKKSSSASANSVAGTTLPVSTGSTAAATTSGKKGSSINIAGLATSPLGSTGTGTVLSQLQSISEGSTFWNTLSTNQELVSRLSGPGPWTLIIPSNAAFASLPTGLSQSEINTILGYHVMEGFLYGLDIASFPGRSYTMTNGQSLTTNQSPAGFSPTFGPTGMSNIIQADIFAGNGVIHIIDQVLRPDLMGVTAVVSAEKVSEGPSGTASMLGSLVAAFAVSSISVFMADFFFY